jgi:cell wall-associated NlpC family hydrolase
MSDVKKSNFLLTFLTAISVACSFLPALVAAETIHTQPIHHKHYKKIASKHRRQHGLAHKTENPADKVQFIINPNHTIVAKNIAVDPSESRQELITPDSEEALDIISRYPGNAPAESPMRATPAQKSVPTPMTVTEEVAAPADTINTAVHTHFSTVTAYNKKPAAKAPEVTAPLSASIARLINLPPAKANPETAKATPSQPTGAIARLINLPPPAPTADTSAPGHPQIARSVVVKPAEATVTAEAGPTGFAKLFHFHTASSAAKPVAVVQPSYFHQFASSMHRRLVDFVQKTVTTLRYSDYKLGGSKFDTKRGVYVLDCSSFVDHILRKASPQAYSNLVNATGVESPATTHYYSFFNKLSANNSGDFWNKVDDVDQLRPGDILVFRYKNSRGMQTGGHVMVVMDKPIRDTDVYFVRVADSAPSRHSEDTRQRNEGGIGIGTLLLRASKSGRPAAYAWGIGGLWNKNVSFAMARPKDFD